MTEVEQLEREVAALREQLTEVHRGSEPPDPAVRRKDRELGTTIRNLAAVLALIVAVIVGYRQVAEAIEHEVKRETLSVEMRLEGNAKLREATVTSELRSLREQRAADQHELAAFLARLEERMRALEGRR